MPSAFRRDAETWLIYFFLAYFSFFINSIGPVTPLLKSDLGLSYTVAGLHYTAFALGLIVIGIWGRRVIVRYGKGRSLWIGAFGLSLGAVPFLLGRVPAATVPGCFVMGVLGSLIIILSSSMLSDKHGEFRAVAFSEANVIASGVAAVSPLLLGASMRLLGDWRPVLAAGAVLPFVLVFFLRGAASNPASASKAREEKGALPGLYWVYWCAIVLAVAAEFGMISWSGSYLATGFGLDGAASALSMSVFMAAMISGRAAGSRLARSLKPHLVLLWSIALALGGFLVFWLGPSLPLALAGLFATGLGIANFYPFILALAISVAGDRSVKAASTATVASGVAILFIPVVLGRAADAWGIRSAYAALPLVLLCLACLVVATMGRRAASR